MKLAREKAVFQFHKVRLKVNTTLAEWDLSAMFQFHKVRLKDNMAEPLRFEIFLFQFHKVRLKENVLALGIRLDMSFNSIRYD